jgi:predicted transcriptional regulator of viral defense system
MRIAALADRQHGVVARRQLLALGLSRSAIDHRLRSGRLFRVGHGVYAVGRRRITQEGRWMTATLAAGDDSVLSHRSAAGLWRIARPGGAVELTVPTTAGRRRRRRVIIHRTGSLPADEVTRHNAIPVTTVPRTLLDLAEIATRRELERALDEAQFIRRLDLPATRAVLDRHPSRTGARRLARALDDHVIGTTRTNDGLEEDFFLMCRSAGIPAPLVKEQIGPYEVDFLWPDARLVIETDDRASHERNSTYEADRDRDAYLDDLGYRVRRYTWRKIKSEPEEVLSAIRRLLNEARGP